MKPSGTSGLGRRLRVLIFTGCYPPGFRGGGPVRSIVNLVEALAADVDFRIVTLDQDHESQVPYAGVPSGIWVERDGVQVLYLSRAAVSMRRLIQEVATSSPDVVYLNGFFDSLFTVRILLARKAGVLKRIPVLLAPRGDCSAGALELKHLKKTLFIRLARMVGLYNDLTWQASSDLECLDVLATMKTLPRDRVRVVPNLTDDAPVAPTSSAQSSERSGLRICFLSRISRKKNLDYALRVLADVRVAVVFTIYGPVEDAAFLSTCQALIALLPANIRATYGGEVRPEDVRRTLAEHDLLFLPTRGENFGHVIYEALSAGVPVLISDQTPWTDLEAHGAGWSLPLDSPQAFARAIEAASKIQPEQYVAMAQRAAAYAAKRADRPASIRRTYELLRSVAAQ